METNTILAIFTGILAIAVLLQTILFFGIYRAIRELAGRMDGLSKDLLREIAAISSKVNEGVETIKEAGRGLKPITEKLGGEAYYLNAPYLCQSAEMAKSLLETKSVRETISVGKKTDIALLGVGTTSPDYSSFYLAGYVTRRELDDLRRAGAIGDVCGLHFDVNGQPACDDFCERLVSIRRPDLLSIPVRLGVAGGDGKAEAILGALRSKYVNVLVIDSMTARKVLELAKSK